MLVIFTDLDGCLLDPDTYSWDAAAPALQLLEARGLPWVMVSSKTRAEIERLRAALRNTHPFVVENGAAAFIPEGYFGEPVDGAAIRVHGDRRYEVLEWGTSYPALVRALHDASRAVGCPVTGFHEMTEQDVSDATGLPLDLAALARQREFDEAFLAPDTSKISHLCKAIEHTDLRWTHGGRFYHICGNNDKATAVAALADLFAKRYGPIISVGLGDSLNDLPFLKLVDFPVLVRSPRPPSIRCWAIHAHYTRSAGPKGWSEAVTELVS